MKRFKKNWNSCAVWDEDDVVQTGALAVIECRSKAFEDTAKRVAYLKVCAYRAMRSLGCTGLAVHFDSHSNVPVEVKNPVHLSAIVGPGNNREFDIASALEEKKDERREYLVRYAIGILSNTQRKAVCEQYGVLGHVKLSKSMREPGSIAEANSRHQSSLRAIRRMQSYFVDGVLAASKAASHPIGFDLGHRVGPLEVMGPDKARHRHSFWRCRCSCGRTVSKRADTLAKGAKYCSAACSLRIEDLRRRYAGRRVSHQCT